jgi:hypothetical protein
LAIQGLCASIGILGFFFSVSIKNVMGILMEIDVDGFQYYSHFHNIHFANP